jgi:hypothetical protein
VRMNTFLSTMFLLALFCWIGILVKLACAVM